MTVAELIKELSKFDPNHFVAVFGGEGVDGDWAYLGVYENKEDLLWQDGTIILEYSEEFC